MDISQFKWGDTKLSWGGVKAKFYIQHCSKSVKYLAPKIREAWTGPKHASMVGWRLLTSTVAGGWINFCKPSICVVYFKKNTHIEINHDHMEDEKLGFTDYLVSVPLFPPPWSA